VVALEPERTSIAEASAPDPEPATTFTPGELLEIIRSTCLHLDPENAEAYWQMDASHVRQAVRFNSRLLTAHREYQRAYRINRRGRREHANAIYRHLDIVPIPYTVVAMAWSLLPATILDAPEPDASHRSPLRTAT
jgi:hypothetical protein